MIKAIIFDCFGVLTTDPWLEFCADIPPGPMLEQLKYLNHAFDANHISQNDFIEQVHTLTGRSLKEVQQIFSSDSNKNTQLLDYIKTLKPRYKIGLLSNVGSNWVRESFLTAKEQQLFDQMILSFEVGVTKPDRQIFEIACQKLGVQPKDAVMIDDRQGYCDAAEAVGLKSVCFLNTKQCKADLDRMLANA